jgi:hypothetical protein
MSENAEVPNAEIDEAAALAAIDRCEKGGRRHLCRRWTRRRWTGWILWSRMPGLKKKRVQKDAMPPRETPAPAWQKLMTLWTGHFSRMPDPIMRLSRPSRWCRL